MQTKLKFEKGYYTWDEYKKIVRRISDKIRYRSSSKPGFQWDHILSVKGCFELNIHPYVCASKVNLQQIPTSKNLSKGSRIKWGAVSKIMSEYRIYEQQNQNWLIEIGEQEISNLILS